jgi:hypothetical protein
MSDSPVAAAVRAAAAATAAADAVALLQASSQGCEPGGEVNQVIDRNGQVSGVLSFDGLGRPVQVGYGGTVAAPTAYKSTLTNTWDAANRLTMTVAGQPTATYSWDDAN